MDSYELPFDAKLKALKGIRKNEFWSKSVALHNCLLNIDLILRHLCACSFIMQHLTARSDEKL